MGSFLSSLLGGGLPPAEDSSASSEESRVTSFHSSARWQLHFNSIKDTSKLVLVLKIELDIHFRDLNLLFLTCWIVVSLKLVIDFSASWCGPCRFIEPAIHAMAAKFIDVDFAKIDVDELSVCSFPLSTFNSVN